MLAGCSSDLGSNLLKAARDTSAVWRGNAATAVEEGLIGKTTVQDDLSDACLFYAARYRDAAQSAIECFDTVGDLATDLIETLVYAQITAAVGTGTIETVIGGVIGYSVAASYAARAIELYYEVEGAIKILKTTVLALVAAMDAYNAARNWRMQNRPRLPFRRTTEPSRREAVMSETRLGPLERSVPTTARSAPGTRGKIAEVAATILEGGATASAAAKDATAQAAFAEAGAEGLAKALPLAKEEPAVAEQVRRLVRPQDTQ